MIPIFVIPALAATSEVVVAVKLGAVQVSDNLHCEIESPLWYVRLSRSAPATDINIVYTVIRIRFLGYTGVSWVLSFPTFILAIFSGIRMWRNHKTHRHISRELYNTTTPFSPLRSAPFVTNAPLFPTKFNGNKPGGGFLSSTGRVIPDAPKNRDPPTDLRKPALPKCENKLDGDSASTISSVIFHGPPSATLEPGQRFGQADTNIVQDQSQGNFRHLHYHLSYMQICLRAQTSPIGFLSPEVSFQASGVLSYFRCKSSLLK